MYSYNLIYYLFIIGGFILWLAINSTLINGIYDYFFKKTFLFMFIFLNLFFFCVWILCVNIINIYAFSILSILMWAISFIFIDYTVIHWLLLEEIDKNENEDKDENEYFL
jgi:hypothetical protein